MYTRLRQRASWSEVKKKSPPTKPTKHIVVNAAFNHGNSGGPLLLAQENSVIGVVVMTFHFYPPAVHMLIEGMANQKAGFHGNAERPDEVEVLGSRDHFVPSSCLCLSRTATSEAEIASPIIICVFW